MGSYYMKANLMWPRYYKQMSADHWCHGDNGGSSLICLVYLSSCSSEFTIFLNTEEFETIILY